MATPSVFREFNGFTMNNIFNIGKQCNAGKK